MKDKFIPIEQLLMEEIAREEKINPQKFYQAKLPAIKVAQEMGLPDETIEKAFGIKIMPEDRKS